MTPIRIDHIYGPPSLLHYTSRPDFIPLMIHLSLFLLLQSVIDSILASDYYQCCQGQYDPVGKMGVGIDQSVRPDWSTACGAQAQVSSLLIFIYDRVHRLELALRPPPTRARVRSTPSSIPSPFTPSMSNCGQLDQLLVDTNLDKSADRDCCQPVQQRL